MTTTTLRKMGHELQAEEQTLLFKVAMQTATPEEHARHDELTGLLREIEARLFRAGDVGLNPTPIG